MAGALALPGCPESRTATEDATVVPMDAGAETDAPPLEACDAPGTSETLPCGMCGERTRFCTSALRWEYTACASETGVCLPGTTRDEPCGRCGRMTVGCNEACEWSPVGACHDEAGECLPGTREVSVAGCPSGSLHARTCGALCSWGPFDACTSGPEDADADGAVSAVDCDDTDPTVLPGSSRPCGLFVCGVTVAGTPDLREGTRRCIGPDTTECERPVGCPEPTGAVCEATGGSARESSLCPRARWDCGDTVRLRSCSGAPGAMTWTPWSPACPTPVTAPPLECTPATSCGECDEGLAFTVCNFDCVPTVGVCEGRGCSPGARTRTTSSCPAGEYSEAVCNASCAFEATSCQPFVAEVDVIVLVDNTGSHTATVMASAGALATELVGPLVADMDVRVGVASYADFPVGAYGVPSDEPFRGILPPTSDSTAVASALSSVAAHSGNDWPESLVEALSVLADRPAHPSSAPFTSCPAGTMGGGCWRPGAQRVVVVVTDAPGHGMPDAMGGVASPYGPDLVPPAPAWADVRAALRATGTAVFYIVAERDVGDGVVRGDAQARIVVTELGMDPSIAIATYPGDGATRDLTVEARTLAPRIAAYVGAMAGP